MGLTTAAKAAPALSLRRSDRLKKYTPRTPKMATIQKDDVQDTYVLGDTTTDRCHDN
jgi:cullin 1